VKKSSLSDWGVVIHPDIGHKILRHMVKELACYDLRFLSYGQKTAIFGNFLPKKTETSEDPSLILILLR